ncbi:helix-turn-helix domain-containing protein [Paenibacillus caseinilyticus]|uniref:helix-turn-helix domain-containing protein n=1 Tax=Paenibacillus caseinilyticus TaxID=3098138 RepID=UPI0022B860B0|nr:helix-turn-helix domain-containing protein [Paenibacillus caseinilyticus]MCZ8518906.1 DNA-binding protein [Paenibacillus caseinilyticus]
MKLTFSSREELIAFIEEEVINTTEATEILECTRQNLSDQIRRGKLKAIKNLDKDRLFLRSDVLARKAEIDEYKQRHS